VVGRPCGSARVVTWPGGLWSAIQTGSTRATGSPSTATRSVEGSTRVPSSVTTRPLTETRPARIIDSAARRDATPARERYFWRRMSPAVGAVGRGTRAAPPAAGNLHDAHVLHPAVALAGAAALPGANALRGTGAFTLATPLPEHDRQVVRPGQIVERAESEVFEELGRRPVEERPPEPLPATRDRDQLPLLQRSQDARGADAPDLLDLGPPDRLPVRDDRQDLERRGRELRRTDDRVEPLEVRRVLRARQELVATRDVVDLEGVSPLLVLLPQRLDRPEDRRLVQRLVRARQLLDPKRRIAGKEERLNDPLRLHPHASHCACTTRGPRTARADESRLPAVSRARGSP